MIGDASAGLVSMSSLFTMMDVCDDPEPTPGNVGFYGLLAATCEGTHPYENKTVDHVKPAFVAARSVMSLFDDDIVPAAAVSRVACDDPPAGRPEPVAPSATPALPRRRDHARRRVGRVASDARGRR